MSPPQLPPPADLLALIPDPLLVVDEHGRLLYANAAIETLLGYRPDELLGGYMIEHVHPDDRGTTLNVVWRLMSGPDPTVRFRNRWIHKDGHPVEIEWSARWSAEQRVRVAVARLVSNEA